jgi:integrase
MTLDRHNAKLDRVKIRQKGSRLYLRATLPPKNGEGAWKQHEIKTGCPATDQGIKSAFGKAQRLESDLIFDRFDWIDWTPQSALDIKNNCETAIAEYEKYFWETRPKNATTEDGYRSHYQRYFDYLPQDEPFTIAVIKETLLKFDVDSFYRKHAYQAYKALSDLHKLDWPKEFAPLRGKWKAKKRHVPSDAEIIKALQKIDNKGWRWIAGILATYGLRPHELFQLDLSQFPIIATHEDTKTGSRKVWPVPSDWVELFDLGDRHWPNFQLKGTETNKDLGSRICSGFRPFKLGFTAYGLRDAFAVRCALKGVDSAIASRLMGHGIEIHYRHYHSYIDEISMGKILGKI